MLTPSTKADSATLDKQEIVLEVELAKSCVIGVHKMRELVAGDIYAWYKEATLPDARFYLEPKIKIGSFPVVPRRQYSHGQQ